MFLRTANTYFSSVYLYVLALLNDKIDFDEFFSTQVDLRIFDNNWTR